MGSFSVISSFTQYMSRNSAHRIWALRSSCFHTWSSLHWPQRSTVSRTCLVTSTFLDFNCLTFTSIWYSKPFSLSVLLLVSSLDPSGIFSTWINYKVVWLSFSGLPSVLWNVVLEEHRNPFQSSFCAERSCKRSFADLRWTCSIDLPEDSVNCYCGCRFATFITAVPVCYSWVEITLLAITWLLIVAFTQDNSWVGSPGGDWKVLQY